MSDEHTPDRHPTIGEVGELVLLLARHIGELRRRVDELEAELADPNAKITPDQPTRRAPQ